MRAIARLGVAALLATIVGCGSVTTTDHKRGGNGDRDQVVPVTAPAHCVHLKPAPGEPSVSLSDADNHKTFCVKRGTGVFVFLHGALPHMWSPILSSSDALARRPSGMMALARGVTGAYYVAVTVGRTTLTSSESRCPNEPHPAAKSRCPAPMRYSVTVDVLQP